MGWVTPPSPCLGFPLVHRAGTFLQQHRHLIPDCCKQFMHTSSTAQLVTHWRQPVLCAPVPVSGSLHLTWIPQLFMCRLRVVQWVACWWDLVQPLAMAVRQVTASAAMHACLCAACSTRKRACCAVWG